MGMLHQVLAVLATKKKIWSDRKSDMTRMFGNVGTYFVGKVITVEAHDAARSNELNSVKHQALTTTVDAKLRHTCEALEEMLDAQFQSDLANKVAKADLIIDGEIIKADVPAVTLLAIEREFTSLFEAMKSAPTLPAGIDWIIDTTSSLTGSYVNKHDVVVKTHEQRIQPQILFAGNDKHPPQIDKLPVNFPIADQTTRTFSGAKSSAEQAALLAKIQKVITAAGDARLKANVEEAPGEKIAGAIMKTIFG